jgi:hypothetical protein
MIRRRAEAADVKTEIGCDTFRATGITAYLKNGGRLEVVQQTATHESARTTGLYDRRGDDVRLDEVERSGFEPRSHQNVTPAGKSFRLKERAKPWKCISRRNRKRR